MGIMEDFHELKSLATKGRLVGVCSVCLKGYKRIDINSNICSKCMGGVEVPTF